MAVLALEREDLHDEKDFTEAVTSKLGLERK